MLFFFCNMIIVMTTNVIILLAWHQMYYYACGTRCDTVVGNSTSAKCNPIVHDNICGIKCNTIVVTVLYYGLGSMTTRCISR